MGQMHYGVHRTLEAEADRLIKESLRGVTKFSEKADILTPWKQSERRRREVFVPSGTPDAAVRKGIYGRALNTRQTHLNSRDGIAAASGMNGLNEFIRNSSGNADSIYSSIYDPLVQARGRRALRK